MARTKNRALVQGRVSKQSVILFAIILGIIGIAILGLYTNGLTLTLALLGYIFYVAVYGFYKRKSVHGTLVGSISGALPPVIGYCAVSDRLDGAALILFLILVCWQMPHFYAIAMYRSKDYAAAAIPVLPVVNGVQTAKKQMLLYTIGFVLAALSLMIFGYAGIFYGVFAATLGAAWIALALQGFKASDNNAWAKKMFFTSLIIILVLCTAISVDSFIPY